MQNQGQQPPEIFSETDYTAGVQPRFEDQGITLLPEATSVLPEAQGDPAADAYVAGVCAEIRPPVVVQQPEDAEFDGVSAKLMQRIKQLNTEALAKGNNPVAHPIGDNLGGQVYFLAQTAPESEGVDGVDYVMVHTQLGPLTVRDDLKNAGITTALDAFRRNGSVAGNSDFPVIASFVRDDNPNGKHRLQLQQGDKTQVFYQRTTIGDSYVRSGNYPAPMFGLDSLSPNDPRLLPTILKAKEETQYPYGKDKARLLQEYAATKSAASAPLNTLEDIAIQESPSNRLDELADLL